MKPFHLLSAAALLLASLPAAHVQAPDSKLATVLAQMDTASKNFKGARADFSQDYYERVAKDTTTETGSIYFLRAGNGTQMGAVKFGPDGKTKVQVYEFKDGLLRILDVRTGEINNVKSGSNQAMVETFLTLGFGGSGKDLARQWTVTDQGQETLSDAGQPVKTEKLDLVSKDPSILKTFTHVTIWVDPVRGVSLKQVFETPSHDVRTTTYSHIKMTGKVDTGFFALKK